MLRTYLVEIDELIEICI